MLVGEPADQGLEMLSTDQHRMLRGGQVHSGSALAKSWPAMIQSLGEQVVSRSPASAMMASFCSSLYCRRRDPEDAGSAPGDDRSAVKVGVPVLNSILKFDPP